MVIVIDLVGDDDERVTAAPETGQAIDESHQSGVSQLPLPEPQLQVVEVELERSPRRVRRSLNDDVD